MNRYITLSWVLLNVCHMRTMMDTAMVVLIILLFILAWALAIHSYVSLYRIARVVSEESSPVNCLTVGNHMFRYLHRYRALPPETKARTRNLYRNFLLATILSLFLGLTSIALLAYRLGTFQSLLG